MKNRIESAFIFAQDSNYAKALYRGMFEIIGGWRLLDNYLDGVRKVTPEMVQKVAQKYLIVDRSSVGTLVPVKANKKQESDSGSKRGKMVMKKIYLYIFLILALLLSWSISAVSAASLEINEFFLSNGVKVLHVERQNLPVVTMSILVKASPRDEEPSKAGLAWMTARLLTDGTTTKKGPEISEEIEYLGASLGTSVSSDFYPDDIFITEKGCCCRPGAHKRCAPEPDFF